MAFPTGTETKMAGTSPATTQKQLEFGNDAF